MAGPRVNIGGSDRAAADNVVTDRDVADLRMVPLAGAAWAAAWLGTWGTGPVWTLIGVAVAAIGVFALRRRSALLVATAVIMVALAGFGGLLAHRVSTGPVPTLAAQRAAVSAELIVRTDLRVSEGRGVRGGYGTAQARIVQISGRGGSYLVRAPVLIIATGSAVEAWKHTVVGSRVAITGRLEAADRGSGLAAIVRVRTAPQLVRPPGVGLRGVERVRQGLREAVADRSPEAKALVPALVLGDISALGADLSADFRTTGLTHLTAVSGANLTLLLAFLLTLGRWAGIRGWWLRSIGLVGVIIFVGLCRTEPSVLRAAAMGLVALAALGSGARRAGLRNLSVAAVLLLIADPFLSRSIGFALSVLASAGIVWWARRWTVLLNRWLPLVIAEAVAVPLAAQLATQPVVAAISGRISISGLLANALAGPLVGPATVLGFAAAAASLVSTVVAVGFGFGAAWCAQVIIWIARGGARLPGSSTHWPVSVASLAWLVAACLTLAWLLPHVLSRPWLSTLLGLSLVSALAVAPTTPGWPPPGWMMVACDVGQGDGLVIRVGPRTAVVIDSGPDQLAMGRCLDQLRITAVPLIVLSHFHADHVDGLAAVSAGREVGQVWVSPLATPAYEADRVRSWAAQTGAVVTSPPPGTGASVGSVALEVLGPVPHVTGGPDESSTQNDESLVVMVTTGALRLLLTGDVEPAGQKAIEASGADLRADVLKIPHHGSARQDPEFFAATGARIAIASAGEHNDYGHPAPKTVRLVASLGMTLLRTDQQGAVAITVVDGEVRAVAQR